jgi:predicted nucleic acid-binding protein
MVDSAMIVLDASAIVTGLIHSGRARQLMSGGFPATSHLADAEVVHALRRRTMRGELGMAEATRLLATWQEVGVLRHSSVGLFDRIWQLRDNVTAYDATYVALAEALDCPLATTDQRLANAPGIACEMVLVTG